MSKSTMLLGFLCFLAVGATVGLVVARGPRPTTPNACFELRRRVTHLEQQRDAAIDFGRFQDSALPDLDLFDAIAGGESQVTAKEREKRRKRSDAIKEMDAGIVKAKNDFDRCKGESSKTYAITINRWNAFNGGIAFSSITGVGALALMLTGSIRKRLKRLSEPRIARNGDCTN